MTHFRKDKTLFNTLDKSFPAERDRQLVYKYGINLNTYYAMLMSQGHACAICRITLKAHGKNSCVDHCHNTGKVRGILCNSCNLGIAYLQEDPEIMDNAKEYLS